MSKRPLAISLFFVYSVIYMWVIIYDISAKKTGFFFFFFGSRNETTLLHSLSSIEVTLTHAR